MIFDLCGRSCLSVGVATFNIYEIARMKENVH